LYRLSMPPLIPHPCRVLLRPNMLTPVIPTPEIETTAGLLLETIPPVGATDKGNDAPMQIANGPEIVGIALIATVALPVIVLKHPVRMLVATTV